MSIDAPMPERKSDVLDHIERGSPPWARDHFTECGRNVNDVKACISYDAAAAKYKNLGRQRASFSTCMTCVDRAQVHSRWDLSPIGVVHRYCERQHYYSSARWVKDPSAAREGERIEQELRALAMLVEAHRDEFDAALTDMEGAASFMDAKRAKLRPQ